MIDRRSLCLAVFLSLQALTASGKDIAIAMGNFEPYFIAKNNSGIFADIVSAVFQKMPGYQPQFFYGFTNRELWSSFQSGQIDAATNIFDSVDIEGCRTDPVFRFRDVAITKAKNNFQLNNLADLKGKTVVMFEGAREFFGEDFASNITAASVELGKPELQVRILFAERYQVSVGDLFIFLQAIKNLNDPAVTPDQFVVHNVLPVNYSRLAFQDIELCQPFNVALQQLKDSGEYERIYQRYLKDLGYHQMSGAK